MSEVETRRRSQSASLSAASPVTRTMPAQPGTILGAGSEEGSFGRALAAAREARQLSQSEVAAQLRLHPRQVKAIEEENLAGLPEGPYVRGYVRNFARLVDLPAEPLLQLLNARLGPTDPLTGAGAAAPMSAIQRMPREPLSGRLVIGGAVALLLMFAAFGWWAMRSEQATLEAQPAEPAPTARAAAAQPVPEAAPAAAGVEPASDTRPNADSAGNVLRLAFRGRSWVEIRQADGTVLMSQNNAPGTVQTVEGQPPFTLVIGNASLVELEFRGKVVDLAGASNRDDVARLPLD